MRRPLPKNRPAVSTEAGLTLLGFAALVIGLALYFVVRDPASIYALSSINLSIEHTENTWPSVENSPFFELVAGSLPSALHAFSFSLITAVAVGVTACSARIVCTYWAGIDIAFESLQAREYFCGQNAATTNVSDISCLLQGRFDWFDIAAVFVGTLIAYYFLTSFLKTSRTGE